MSNLLKLANFIWEKVQTRKEPKKIQENKQIRTFQNQLIRPEIAVLDRFDFHLVTGEKVSSHSDIIHSPFQGKQFCCNSDCLQFFIQFFVSSSFLLFPDFFMRLQWNYFIKIFDTDLLNKSKISLFTLYSGF